MPPPSTSTAAVSEGLPKEFFFLNAATGMFDRINVTHTPCVGVDEQLRTLANNVATFIPAVFSTPNSAPVHMNVSRSLMTLVVKLQSLRVATYFSVQKVGGETYLTPIFRDDGMDTTLRISPEWTPPPNMGLFIAVHFESSPTGWRFARASLVTICTDKNVPGIYMQPLPNLYPNGKICLGNTTVMSTYQPAPTTPLSVVVDNVVTSFQQSNWNSDLIDNVNMDVTRGMFRFSAKDNKTQLEGPKHWPTIYSRINNTDFDNIPFHSLV